MNMYKNAKQQNPEEIAPCNVICCMLLNQYMLNRHIQQYVTSHSTCHQHFSWKRSRISSLISES